MEAELRKKSSGKKRVLIVALILVMFLGISFASVNFIYNFNDSRDNKLKTGLVSLAFEEGNENINLQNTLPMSDPVGLENDPYVFTITNTSKVPINARVILDVDSKSTLPVGAVRYALYVNDELIEKDSLANIKDNTLYLASQFSPNQTLNLKVVFWVDYYYDESGKTFSARIKVSGESYDVIPEESVQN